MRWLQAILLIVSAANAYPAFGQERTVDRMTIKSMWGGILEYSETDLAYVRRDDKIFLDLRPIDLRKVRALIDAIRTSPVAREDAFRARISQMWLDRYAHFEERQQRLWLDAQARTTFEALFRDRDFMSQMFASLFDTVTLDDNPRVELVIRFADGEEWTARSFSNHLFMLPWTVHRGDEEVETFDLNIAKAIGLLLPEEATNRWRLLGEDAPEKLGRQIRRHLDTSRAQ